MTSYDCSHIVGGELSANRWFTQDRSRWFFLSRDLLRLRSKMVVRVYVMACDTRNIPVVNTGDPNWDVIGAQDRAGKGRIENKIRRCNDHSGR